MIYNINFKSLFLSCLLMLSLGVSFETYGQNKPLDRLNKDELRDSIQKLELQRDSLDSLVLQQSQKIVSLKNETLKYDSILKENDSAILNLQQWLSDTMNVRMVETFVRETYGKEALKKTNNAAGQFFRLLMESPLFYAYNDSLISQSLEMADLLGCSDKNHPYYKYVYCIYKPLLEKYRDYTLEIANAVEGIMADFTIEGKDHINRKKEESRFESSYKSTLYYQDTKVKTKGDKYGSFRHIAYLDYQIHQIYSLFKSDDDFKPENFKEIYDKLMSGINQ